MKQECKDCIEPLEDCACIENTIDFPKQEVIYSVDEVEDLIYKICGTVARLQGITLNGNHIDTAYNQHKTK